jgi:outer membrane protein
LFNAATAGATASIDSVATVSLSVLHMFTDQVAAELTLGVPPRLDLDVQLRSGSHTSWAPVYNAGLIYNINERLSVNASVSYSPLKTTATFVGSGTTTTGRLKLNPVDYVVRLGYKF